jgi:hypothetical protein
MSMRDMAKKLVEDFGKTLTVGLTLDEMHNSCVLLFDENVVLNIEYDDAEERLLFFVYLDELPSEGAEPLLRMLLEANLFWHKTRGATLSLEEGTNGIVLAYAHAVALLDTVQFEAVVENFVQLAEDWKKRIEELKAAATGAPALSDPPKTPVVFA